MRVALKYIIYFFKYILIPYLFSQFNCTRSESFFKFFYLMRLIVLSLKFFATISIELKQTTKMVLLSTRWNGNLAVIYIHNTDTYIVYHVICD